MFILNGRLNSTTQCTFILCKKMPLMPMCIHRCMPIIKTEKIPHQVIAGNRKDLPGAHGVDRLPSHAKACVDQSHSRLAPGRALRFPAVMY